MIKLPVRHKHNWKLTDKTTFKSQYEILMETGATNIPQWVSFKRKIVTTYTCECGKIKRYTDLSD